VQLVGLIAGDLARFGQNFACGIRFALGHEKRRAAAQQQTLLTMLRLKSLRMGNPMAFSMNYGKINGNYGTRYGKSWDNSRLIWENSWKIRDFP
jgi:hypothetical protein